MMKKIHNFALKNSESNDLHGFPHVKRVCDLSLKIGKKLDANIKVLIIAALLHDVGRKKKEKDTLKRNHAEISAKIAFKFLTSNNLNLSKEEIWNVIHCIKAHSFSNEITPKTLEAQILSDADKLDALGAIGLYRTIGFTVINKGGVEQVIEHLEKKIMKLKNKMYLDFSKEIAKEREKIILNFYNQIINEK